MIKLLLPVILVLVLFSGGLWYWRVQANKQPVSPQSSVAKVQAVTGPVEVPKALPGASLEDRVKSLEDLAAKLVSEINNLKAAGAPKTQASSSIDTSNLEAAVTELKARVSALEKATPVPVSNSSQSTVYIPLGAGGSWTDIDWNSLAEYEASLDPGNYPSYTGMSLEVIFRMNESAGTASVRLYNMTDNSAVSSSQLDTTSNVFSLKSSSSFKLPSGTKTYRLQVKSSQRTQVFIQSARIKVNF